MSLHRNIKLLTWFNFFLDFKLYAPVAIIYFANVTGSYAFGLAVFSVQMISSSIFEIPTGILSDFIGRKKTVVLGSISGVLALIFYALGHNFFILVLGSVFLGLSESFYSGNNQALLFESLREKRQHKDYQKHSGKTGSMFQLGLAVSAFLGSIIAFYSFPTVMWLSVIPQILCLLISLRITEPRARYIRESTNILNHLKQSMSNFKKNKKLRLLSLSSILDFGIGETAYQFIPAFVNTLWPLWAVGAARALSNILATIGMRISSRVTKRVGFLKTFIVGGMYNRLIGILATSFPTIFSPLLASSSSLSYGINGPAQDTLFQKMFSHKQRATMGSLNSLAGNLFFAVFAFGFGFVADQLKPAHSLLIAQFLMFPILLLYWIIFRKKN